MYMKASIYEYKYLYVDAEIVSTGICCAKPKKWIYIHMLSSVCICSYIYLYAYSRIYIQIPFILLDAGLDSICI